MYKFLISDNEKSMIYCYHQALKSYIIFTYVFQVLNGSQKLGSNSFALIYILSKCYEVLAF